MQLPSQDEAPSSVSRLVGLLEGRAVWQHRAGAGQLKPGRNCIQLCAKEWSHSPASLDPGAHPRGHPRPLWFFIHWMQLTGHPCHRQGHWGRRVGGLPFPSAPLCHFTELLALLLKGKVWFSNSHVPENLYVVHTFQTDTRAVGVLV